MTAPRGKSNLHTPQLLCCLLILFAAGMEALAGAASYPLKVSANGRYLVDQNNLPYLIIGDSPQSLIVNLTDADAEFFIANRMSYGFNTLWINLLCTTYTGGRPDGSTIDGILPFTAHIGSTSSYDLTTPNEAYFEHVDEILNLAAQYGMAVLLDPIETGGFLTTMRDNGTAKCRIYGRYLGDRYKNFPNIVWMSGNDFQDWGDPNNNSVVKEVASGIQDKDRNHLHTIELGFPVSSSLDNASWRSIVKLNATYTYYPTYAELLKDYNRSSFLPNFMVEANYEFEDNFGNLGELTPQIMRRQEYWTMLCGATGQMYGNHYTWSFISGWQSNLDTPGSIQITYLRNLFNERRWYDLIPDQAHTLVTAGYGTFSTKGAVTRDDYATAAQTADGTFGIVYMPTIRPITVDMTKSSGPTSVRWFDPSRGSYTTVPGSPFPNTGSRTFRPPGRNGDFQGDWVLVLETKPH